MTTATRQLPPPLDTEADMAQQHLSLVITDQGIEIRARPFSWKDIVTLLAVNAAAFLLLLGMQHLSRFNTSGRPIPDYAIAIVMVVGLVATLTGMTLRVAWALRTRVHEPLLQLRSSDRSIRGAFLRSDYPAADLAAIVLFSGKYSSPVSRFHFQRFNVVALKLRCDEGMPLTVPVCVNAGSRWQAQRLLRDFATHCGCTFRQVRIPQSVPESLVFRTDEQPTRSQTDQHGPA